MRGSVPVGPTECFRQGRAQQIVAAGVDDPSAIDSPAQLPGRAYSKVRDSGLPLTVIVSGSCASSADTSLADPRAPDRLLQARLRQVVRRVRRASRLPAPGRRKKT
ncbi:MAG: hypothetical protein ACODAD_10055, partial [Planctomycetota bacterium]